VINYVDSFSKIAVVLSNGALLFRHFGCFLTIGMSLPAMIEGGMEFGRARINGYQSEKMKIQYVSINKGGGPYYPH
jgi:hypothetical protein